MTEYTFDYIEPILKANLYNLSFFKVYRVMAIYFYFFISFYLLD